MLDSQSSLLWAKVASACGSGIAAAPAASAKRAKRANSSSLPARTAAASVGSKSQKYRNGVVAPNSSPMNSSGGEGASNTIATAAASAAGSASTVSRSPKARLPTWSWFCRNETNAVSGSPAVELPRAPPAQRRMLTLIGEAVGQATAEMLERRIGVVDVVAVALAGQAGVQAVVDVVVPLRRVAPGGAVGVAREKVRRVVVVLQDQVDVPAAGAPASHRRRQLVEEMRRRIVANRVHGVEAQAVEVKLVEPVQRVVDEEVAHDAAVLAVEIDRLRPTACDGAR